MEYVLPLAIALITSIFGPMLIEWIKIKLSKAKPDPLNEAIKHNESVNHQLEIIVEELKGDRIWIAMFHNGGHFYPTGKSIQKFSIFHERTTLDTDSIMDTFQNIPVSLFPKSLAKLYNEGEIHINNEDIYEFNFFSKNHGINSLDMFTIEDLEGRFIGIMAIEFKKTKKFNTENYIFIRNKIGIIGSILSSYLTKTK
jgi:hypothetical protein